MAHLRSLIISRMESLRVLRSKPFQFQTRLLLTVLAHQPSIDPRAPEFRLVHKSVTIVDVVDSGYSALSSPSRASDDVTGGLIPAAIALQGFSMKPPT